MLNKSSESGVWKAFAFDHVRLGIFGIQENNQTREFTNFTYDKADSVVIIPHMRLEQSCRSAESTHDRRECFNQTDPAKPPQAPRKRMVIVKTPGAYLDTDLAIALSMSQEEHVRASLDAKEFLPEYSSQNPPYQLYPTIEALPISPEYLGPVVPPTAPVPQTSDKLPPNVEFYNCADCATTRCVRHLSSRRVTAIVSWFLLMDAAWVLFFTAWIIAFSVFTTVSIVFPIIGVPLFVAFAYTWRGLAFADLRLLNHLTGCKTTGTIKLVHEQGPVKTFKAMFTSSQTWGTAMYAWIRFVLAMVMFPVAWMCFFVFLFTCFCIDAKRVFYPVIVLAFWQRGIAHGMFGRAPVQSEPVVRV